MIQADRSFNWKWMTMFWRNLFYYLFLLRLKIFNAAAKNKVDAKSYESLIPNLSLIWSVMAKFSTYGQNKVITVVKM